MVLGFFKKSFLKLILAQIYSRGDRPHAAQRELEDFLLRHPDSHLSERVRVGIERHKNLFSESYR